MGDVVVFVILAVGGLYLVASGLVGLVRGIRDYGCAGVAAVAVVVAVLGLVLVAAMMR